MPNVIFHRNGETFVGEVKDNTNLVVRAGIRQFPYPNFLYGCGMGKCGKCASLIIKGGEHLPEPNWKEKKRLGARIEQGYRLACQLWLTHDVELSQEAAPLLDVVAPAGAAVGRT
ncbi:MAG TPA: 2Fe-2S iron-sulfur cluster-binding protein [Bradyrhizobium sp.]